ncbi:MAG: hypothetical protein FWG99_12435 [Treponema sp.]|nr:hypothetical protein [Treponema sp.]
MKHFFVINPHSFHKPEILKGVTEDIDSSFSSRTGDYQIYTSRHPRDAVAAVRRYLLTLPADEAVRIYAVGGDGILFDCLNGMIKFPNAELTSVPYGNANDYVRAFGEDAAPAFRDIKCLAASPSQPVDVINCGSNYALIEANVGLVGQTVIRANAVLRGPRAKWVRPFTPHIYTMSAVRALTNFEVIRQKYQVLLDGEDYSGAYANIHVANIPCDGGTFVPSPYAVPNDGVLDVIFMATSSSMEVLKNIDDRNSGRFEKSDIFVYKKCRSLKVNSQASLSVQMDGEAFYAREFNLEIVPGGVRFFAPEGLSFADYSHRAYKKGTRAER